MKKSSTLKFIMNISFVPSVCIHRPIILIFIEKSMLADFFPHEKNYFPAIFNFHFRENPRFCDEFQALLNGRNVQTICQTVKRHEETMIFLSQRPIIIKGEGERERDGEREREREREWERKGEKEGEEGE